MRFMIIVKGTADTEAGMMPEQKLADDMAAYHEELVAAGMLVDGSGLQPTAKGFRIRWQDGGRQTVIDGPFTESKEIIAGYWLWEVSSLEEAVEWAKRCPTDPQYGARQVLEVRPIFSAEDFGDAYTEDLQAQDARLGEEIKARHGATKTASAS